MLFTGEKTLIELFLKYQSPSYHQLTSADVSLKSNSICSNEDRAQHRFKNEWTLVRLFLINHALLLSARSKSRGEAWRCVVKNVMPQLFLSTGFSNPFSM